MMTILIGAFNDSGVEGTIGALMWLRTTFASGAWGHEP